MRLYDWQTEALQKWEENQFRGIANVVTGAGKTVFAMAAISRLHSLLGHQVLKVKIIVPKTFLVRQWLYALKEVLGVPRKDIGMFLGGHKDKSDCKFMIYVINSARYTFTRHILEDYKARHSVFIIADECHHYGTQENSRIFDFVKVFPNFTQYYTLGLSATPYSKNYESVLEPYLGQEIYSFTFSEALKANIISRFSVLNIGLEFSPDERAEYNDLSDKIVITMHQLRKFCPYLFRSDNKNFFGLIEDISKTHRNPDVRQLTQALMLLFYRRKKIVYDAASRAHCVKSLIGLIDKNSKIIVFGERIEAAEKIYCQLKALYPNEVGIYHSGIHGDTRKNTLRKFEDCQIRILVSCKTLDEGLNISDADVGIIASSTSSKRQRIQRLGRILRKKDGGRQAYFYYLYVKDTMEEARVFNELSDNIEKGINIIDLYYDAKTSEFTNSYYEELTCLVVSKAREKLWDEDKITELKRNIKIGIIVCDWFMSSVECIEKIKSSRSKKERNYYISILMMIRVRGEVTGSLPENYLE